MKKILLTLFISSITLCIGGQSSFADEVFQDGITNIDFHTALKYSLEHNNNIRAMRKNLSATERDIGIEKSLLMPKVKFHENFMVTNNPIEAFTIKLNQTVAQPRDLAFGTLDYPGAVTNFLTSSVVEQPIYNRKAMIEIKMAKKAYSANGYFYLRKQEELVNEVAQAYLQVSTNQELVKVAHQAIEDVNAHLKTAEAKLKANPESVLDVLRAKTAAEKYGQKLVSAQRNLNVSKRKLGLLLGLETPVEVSTPVPDIQLQDIDYYKSFSSYRNDIKATEIKVENAKNNIKSAQADWYPTLNAVASYNLYNSNFPFGAQGSNYIAAAFFKWDAFDGNKRKYEILKAKDKEAEAKEYLEGLKKTVDFKVYEVYQSVEEFKKNLELANNEKKLAEDDTKLVVKRWKNSLSPFINVTDAQANLNEARANVVQCKNNLQSALINLTFESGIIAQELAPE